MTQYLDADAVERVKSDAREAHRGRSHLLLHSGNDDPMHEMLVAAWASSYVRPHQHLRRTESILVLEGEVELLLFGEAGVVTSRVAFGPCGWGGPFHARLEAMTWHSLVARSEVAVFLESKPGPFDSAETALAPWAPPEGDAAAVRRYRRSLAADG